MPAEIFIKRIYDPPSESDGKRILVDRLWPRGIKKEDAVINAWMKEIAPSNELREWFAHDEKKWEEFKIKYFKELDKKKNLSEELLSTGKKKITLLFGAKDKQHNQAAALKEYLELNFLHKQLR